MKQTKKSQKELKELADNPDNIAGIYNYCDYWCERCTFTARCLNFQSRLDDAPEVNDINNKAFWEKLSENLEVALDKAKEKAEELGIDLEALETEKYTKRKEDNRETARQHDLSVTTKDYINKSEEWFNSNEDILEEKNNEILVRFDLELPGSDPEAEAMELDECIDIIRWYQNQIHVKLMRALTYDIEMGGGDPVQNDANGSAKVSLIGMDRSIAAWTELCDLLPEVQDTVIDLLVMLDKIRKRTEAVFPEARNFIRPGFDEE